MDWIDSSLIKRLSCYSRVVPSTDTRQLRQLTVALVSLDPMPTGICLHRNQDVCATQKLIMQGHVSECFEHTYKYPSKQMSKKARVFIILAVTVVLSKC